MLSLVVVLIWLLLGWLCSKLARDRGRNPYVWFILGTLFGVFALLTIYFLRPVDQSKKVVQKRKCDSSFSATSSMPDTSIGELSERGPLTYGLGFDPEAVEWFYLDGNREPVGPLAWYRLVEEAQKGQTVSHSTYVWVDGMVDWKLLGELPKPLLDKLNEDFSV